MDFEVPGIMLHNLRSSANLTLGEAKDVAQCRSPSRPHVEDGRAVLAAEERHYGTSYVASIDIVANRGAAAIEVNGISTRYPVQESHDCPLSSVRLLVLAIDS